MTDHNHIIKYLKENRLQANKDYNKFELINSSDQITEKTEKILRISNWHSAVSKQILKAMTEWVEILNKLKQQWDNRDQHWDNKFNTIGQVVTNLNGQVELNIKNLEIGLKN